MGSSDIDKLIPEISVVTCLYKSEQFLEEFIRQCLIATANCGFNYVEYVFVIDGITDNSVLLLLEKQKHIPCLKIIELSRNYGHHYAVSAGLRESSGELVFLIDCDLEVSPIILQEFYQELTASKFDVVYGVQRSRKGGFVEKYLGGLFWVLFNFLSETKVPRNIITERLMKRQYVDALNSLGDRNLFMAGMMHWVGFNQLGIYVDKKRRTGKSTYNIFKRFALLIQAITSFSERPLVFIFHLGIIITISSLLTAAFFIIRKILYPNQISIGYSSIIASIFISLGVLVSAMGLIGLYLSKIFRQMQGRPNYIIRNKY